MSKPKLSRKPRTGRKLPRTHKGLAEAIFAERDPIVIGQSLLSAESESVRARVWELLIQFAYGKPAAIGNNGTDESMRIIWNLPGPPRETQPREGSGSRHDEKPKKYYQ